MFLRNCNKKENDLKVLVRDQFNNFRVSVSETEESLSSPNQTSSPVETNSNPIDIPGQSENPSRDEIIIRASSLVPFWEAKSQQSSWSRSQSLIESRTSSLLSVSFESLNEYGDKTDLCSQLDKSYVSDSCEKNREARLVRIRGQPLIEEISATIKHDRENELKELAYWCTVSKFSPRGCGRLKYMLRIYSFERCIAIQDRYRLKSAARSSRRNNRDRHKTNAAKVNSLVETRISSRMVSSTVSLDEGETVEKAIVMETVEMNKSLSFAEKVNLWNSMDITNGRKVDDVMSTEIIAKKEELCSFEESSLMEIQEHRIIEGETTSVVYIDTGEEEETMANVDDEETPKTEKSEESEALRLILGSPKFINGSDANIVEEEEEEEEDYSGESVEYNDWFSNISKSRSHWEGLREQRKLEIMNKYAENDVISNMMKRRIVSSFLASEFREKMDKILSSRLKRRFPIEEEEEEEEEEDRLVEYSPSYLENLEESTKSRTMMWSLEDHEGMTTISSNPMDHENTFSETQMIREVQREMLELKSSVSDSEKKNCSVCFEMAIESALYRCGHTCTCLG